MKSFLIPFFLLPALHYAQISNPSASTAPVLQLSVQLYDKVEVNKLPPHCSIFQAQNLTLKYKVVKVVSGNFSGQTILINQRCPRELHEKKLLEYKAVYTYKLVKKNNLSDKKEDTSAIEYEITD